MVLMPTMFFATQVLHRRCERSCSALVRSLNPADYGKAGSAVHRSAASRPIAASWYPVSWNWYEIVSGLTPAAKMRADPGDHLQCVYALLIELAGWQPRSKITERHRRQTAPHGEPQNRLPAPLLVK